MFRVIIWVNETELEMGEMSRSEIEDLIALLKEHGLLDSDGDIHFYANAQFEANITHERIRFSIILNRR